MVDLRPLRAVPEGTTIVVKLIGEDDPLASHVGKQGWLGQTVVVDLIDVRSQLVSGPPARPGRMGNPISYVLNGSPHVRTKVSLGYDSDVPYVLVLNDYVVAHYDVASA